MSAPVELDFDSWLRLGVEAGWVTPDFCFTHDGIPFTLEEEAADEDDPEYYDDPCIHGLRLLQPDAELGFFSRWGKDPLANTLEVAPEVAAVVTVKPKG